MQAVLQQIALTWRLLMDRRVPMWAKAALLLPLLYILSPIDFIPDVILGLGQLDDLGVALAAMKLFEMIAPDYVVAEHRQSLAQGGKQPDIIPGRGTRTNGERRS